MINIVAWLILPSNIPARGMRCFGARLSVFVHVFKRLGARFGVLVHVFKCLGARLGVLAHDIKCLGARRVRGV